MIMEEKRKREIKAPFTSIELETSSSSMDKSALAFEYFLVYYMRV